LLVEKKYLVACLEERFILNLPCSFVVTAGTESVPAQVTFLCTVYKENSTWLISLPCLSFLTELFHHFVDASVRSLFSCQITIKFILSLNLNSVFELTSQNYIRTLGCSYRWFHV